MKLGVQSSEFRVKIKKLLLFCTAVLLLIFSLQPLAFSAEKWQGVDESIVEKYAKEHGREAMTPLINTDQGDLLLFVFLLAGTIGGFAVGYYWKELMQNKKEQKITATQERVHKE